MFFDLNLKSENNNLENARNFYLKVANFHGVSLHPEMTNEEYIESKNKKFPSSPYTPPDHQFLESYQPETLNIQNVQFYHSSNFFEQGS